jgi:hypothetical protein
MIPIEDIERIHLNPGEVLLIRVAKVPSNEHGALTALEEYLGRTFPDNQCMVTDGETEVKVIGSPNWDLVAREVGRRLARNAQRS